MTLSFEDFTQGHFGSFGPRHVTREEIIAFAAEYDPQPMHLDEEAAKHTMLRGLAASGWHLCSIMMRILYDGFIHRTASLGGPGTAITIDVEVLESRVSRNRPQMGLVTMKVGIHNAAGHKLLEAKWPVMIQ